MGWPEWRRRALWRGVRAGLWQGQRWLILGYLGLGVQRVARAQPRPWCCALGCVICEGNGPQVWVERQADGSYQATLCGHFTLQVAGDHLFRMRLLVLFLSLLDVPGDARAAGGRGMGGRRLCGRCRWPRGLACRSRKSVVGCATGRMATGPTC